MCNNVDDDVNMKILMMMLVMMVMLRMTVRR